MTTEPWQEDPLWNYRVPRGPQFWLAKQEKEDLAWLSHLLLDFLKYMEWQYELTLYGLDEDNNPTIEGRNPIEPRIWAYLYHRDKNDD